MNPYLLLKAFHILLIVTWVGIDVGVFSSSFWVRNARLTVETRLQMGKLAGMLDMGPRSSLIVILAAGLLLTYFGNWGFQSAPVAIIWGLVAACAVWLWAVWQQYFTVHDLAAGHSVGNRMVFVRGFRTFDLYLRVAIALALLAIGVLGAAGLSPIGAAWLNLKVAVFGLILLSGVAIRIVADDFPIALGEIARLGSTPEREARLSSALNKAYPWVVGLWGLIVLMTILAVTKPF